MLPGLVILVALAVFYVIEWIAYLPLRAIKWAQQRRGEPPKTINPPSLDLETT